MKNNNSQRANPFDDITNDTIESQLSVLTSEFSTKWLTKDEDHPLQKLWKRKDQISTIELYTFCKAIEKIKKINDKWFKHQKKLILDKNINNRKGAFWEIIGAYYLMDPKNQIVPAPISQKGFDLTSIILETKKKINFSLKYYSFSQHCENFHKKSKAIASLIKTKIIANKINTFQISITKIKSYPTECDWQELYLCIEKILEDIKGNVEKRGLQYKDWLILFSKLPDKIEEYKISEKLNSYTILIHVPYHQNEEKNLISNINDSIRNLKNAEIKEDKNSINSLLIHIPTTASINLYQNQILEYLKQIKENPITHIVLYQPSINFDFKAKKTYLQHCLRITENAETFDTWFNNDIRNKIEFWFQIGVFIQKPFENVLIMDNSAYDLKNHYLFQNGNIFVEPKKLDNNMLFARFGKYTTGINIHTTYQGKVVTTPLEPNDELLIL
ncbi:MAG TPA: hypothetical protein VIK14_15825 [Ignavibacteria bacterium]